MLHTHQEESDATADGMGHDREFSVHLNYRCCQVINTLGDSPLHVPNRTRIRYENELIESKGVS